MRQARKPYQPAGIRVTIRVHSSLWVRQRNSRPGKVSVKEPRVSWAERSEGRMRPSPVIRIDRDSVGYNQLDKGIAFGRGQPGDVDPGLDRSAVAVAPVPGEAVDPGGELRA